MSSHSPWIVDQIDAEIVDRLAAAHVPSDRAAALHVDLVTDPHNEDDAGNVWTLLHTARSVPDVVPGSVVVIGSSAGRWLARVLAWDFEVSDDDPVVTLELLPVAPDAVERALRRNHTPAA